MKKKSLLGKEVKIISDNENYEAFQNKTLIITAAYNEGYFYDKSMYPMMLCEFEVKGTKEKIPNALYEYEFRVLN